MTARAYAFLAVHDAWLQGMLPMMEILLLQKWLIVGLTCTESDSAPAEPNGHARKTTELHMLNIYSSVKDVVYHIMQVTTTLRVDN